MKSVPAGERIPWGNYFKLAVLRFGVTPSEFWKMTPREWWVLYNAVFGQETEEPSMTREELEELEKLVNGGRTLNPSCQDPG